MSRDADQGSPRQLPAELDIDLSEKALSYSTWATALEQGILLGQECTDCGHVTAAPKAACARCGNDQMKSRRLPTEGEVYTLTTVMVAPENFDGPYHVGIIELDGQGEQSPRIMAQVEGDVSIGDHVSFIGVVEADDYPGPLFD